MGEREDLCGRKVGDFVLRERIGRGGFGAVYRCEQPLLGREAVVKVLHRQLRRNDVVLQRFLREAQLASRLDHPYAAHVYAFGIDHADGLFWIAMEMVQGTTLDRWLRERGPLPLDQFVPFFERVAEVVQTAHERGIVHRDLKPSNMMVIERAGRLLPKLLDFGVAKLLDDAMLPEPPEPPRLRLVTLDQRPESLGPSSDSSRSSGGTTSTDSATPGPDRGGRQPRHPRHPGHPLTGAVAFSPDGQLVVTASLDGAERVWNAKTGRQQVELKNHRAAVLSVAFDPSSRQVVSAGADGLVVISDVATGMPVSSLEGARGTVRDARFDPQSRRVIAASWDGTARVWEAPAPYRRWSSLPIDDDCGTDASIEADSRFIAISCKQHGTHVWDTARDLQLAELPGVTPAGNDFEPAFPAVSAEGDRAAIATDNTVTIYGLPGGGILRKVVHSAKVNAVAFAVTGHDLVSASIDGGLLVTQDGREPWALPAFPGGVDVAGFAPDGRVIAAGAAGKLRVYDPVHATAIAELALPIRARSFRMSSDGRRMLVVPTDTKPAPPLLWDLEHPQIIARLEGHVGQVFSARFVRGDREILTAGTDGIARLWDSVTGELKISYFGSNPFLLDSILDPTGTMVITAGGDGVLRFFDATSKDLIWTLRAHKTAIAGLHFEGSYLVTRGFTGEVSRWELPALPSSPAIDDLLRCLPLRFDEATGSLATQAPCDFSIR